MTVPVLTEKYFRHAEQRYGMGLPEGTAATSSTVPQRGHESTPFGQRMEVNQSVAACSVGNMSNSSMTERPSRSDLPGAWVVVFMDMTLPARPLAVKLGI